MRRILRLVLLLLLIPVSYAFVVEAFSFLIANGVQLLVNWMTYGFMLYLIFYVLFLRPKLKFFEVFEHELCHTVMASLFFRSIYHFRASVDKGGEVEHQPPSNMLITLAPYFLPVLTIPVIIIKPFLSATIHNAIDFFLGLTLGFHFAGLFKELRTWQSDIRKTGVCYALVVVAFFNSVFTVLTLSFALGNYAYIIDYFKSALATTGRSYQAIGHTLSNLFIYLQQLATSR